MTSSDDIDADEFLLSPDARAFLDGYRSTVALRYDQLIEMRDIDITCVQEVYVLQNAGDRALRFVPLNPVEAGVQLNRKASDATGRSLILLTLAERRHIYRELFEIAFAALPESDVPGCLAGPMENWENDLFVEDWQSDLTPAERKSLTTWINERYDRLDIDPTPDSAAVAIFLEFLLGRLYQFHRPWIVLDQPLPPTERAFVKYVVDEIGSIEGWQRLRYGLLGRIAWSWSFVRESEGSTHFRLRPPPGMVIQGPTSLPPGTKEPVVSASTVELFLPASGEGSPAADEFGNERRFECFLGQSASQSFLTAGLFAILVTVPLLMIFLAAIAPAHVTVWTLLAGGIPDAVSAWRWVSANDVAIAVGVTLPLAGGMLTSSWTSPPVRGHIIVQFVIASFVVVFMLMARVQPLWGAAAILIAAAISIYHTRRGFDVLFRRGLGPERD